MAFGRLEQERCRRDFPALRREFRGRRLVYLDGPAGTQVPKAVIDAVTRAYTTHNANTHGQFVTSAEADAVLWQVRSVVAAFLGADGPERISFGANMTTLAFALSHAIARRLKPGDEVVITQLDHEANRAPWARLAEHGAVVREVRLLPSGRLDEQDLAAKIGPRTRFVAIGYSSNALGTVNDVELARRLTKACGAWLLVDAVHYAPHFPVDVRALDPDFLLCSAYKFYGPHVGVLYSRPGLLEQFATDILPTQEQKPPYLVETGTLNLAAIEGVGAAVEYLASFGSGASLRERIVDAMTAIGRHEHALAKRYHQAVQQIAGIKAWGSDFATARRAPTVSVTVANRTPAEVAQALGKRGICVWDGDFYAARAIEVLGLAAAGGVLRTGMSMYSSEDDVDQLLNALGEIAA